MKAARWTGLHYPLLAQTITHRYGARAYRNRRTPLTATRNLWREAYARGHTDARFHDADPPPGSMVGPARYYESSCAWSVACGIAGVNGRGEGRYAVELSEQL